MMSLMFYDDLATILWFVNYDSSALWYVLWFYHGFLLMTILGWFYDDLSIYDDVMMIYWLMMILWWLIQMILRWFYEDFNGW